MVVWLYGWDWEGLGRDAMLTPRLDIVGNMPGRSCIANRNQGNKHQNVTDQNCPLQIAGVDYRLTTTLRMLFDESKIFSKSLLGHHGSDYSNAHHHHSRNGCCLN